MMSAKIKHLSSKTGRPLITECANYAGCSRVTVWKYANGKGRNVNISIRIAAFVAEVEEEVAAAEAILKNSEPREAVME